MIVVLIVQVTGSFFCVLPGGLFFYVPYLILLDLTQFTLSS